MSANIDDIKKFLSEKADANNTETLRVDRVAGTDYKIESYRITFLPPQEEKPKEEKPKAEAPKEAPKTAGKKSSKK